MRLRAFWEGFLPTATSIGWASSVALIWFLSHTVPVDKHNILNLLLILLLTVLSLRCRPSGAVGLRVVPVLLVIFVLFVLAAVSGLIVSGDFGSLRTSTLILVFVLLGVVVGISKDQDVVLIGLALGSALVHSQGIAMQYLDPTRLLLSGDYLGVTGRESTEILSAFVGLGVGLALIQKKGGKRLVAAFLLLMNGLIILRINLTIGLIVGAIMFLIALFIRVAGNRAHPISPVRKLAGFTLLGILFLALTTQRSVALQVSEFFGERESVEARFGIWDSALSSVSTSGMIFGHGASFWREGSETLTLTHLALQEIGLRPFGHAHSMYVDLFLSFGLVGLVLLVLLIVLTFRRNNFSSSEEQPLPPDIFTWVLVPSLLVFGLSESALISQPSGWFLASVLLGFLISRPYQDLRPRVLDGR